MLRSIKDIKDSTFLKGYTEDATFLQRYTEDATFYEEIYRRCYVP